MTGAQLFAVGAGIGFVVFAAWLAVEFQRQANRVSDR